MVFAVVVTAAPFRFDQKTVPNDAEFLAATSTNSNKGDPLSVSSNNGAIPDGVTIIARCSGLTAGTTNATMNATYTVYLERSFDGVYYDSPTNSDLKIVVPLNGVVTNQVSIYRNIGGARFIRQGRRENTAIGIVTNIFTGIAGNSPH